MAFLYSIFFLLILFLDDKNQTVNWFINSPHDCAKIIIRFSSFDVEEDNFCSLDYVKIFDVVNSMNLFTLCGASSTSYHSSTSSVLYQLNASFTVPSSSALITFKSDLLNNYAGISFSYTIVKPSLSIEKLNINPYYYLFNVPFSFIIPYYNFVDPLSLNSPPSLSYSVRLLDGSALPYYLNFASDTLLLSGLITDSSILNLSLIIYGVNGCGYINNFTIYLKMNDASVPDSTSQITCDKPSEITSFINSQIVSCYLETKCNSVQCPVLLSSQSVHIISGGGFISPLILINSSSTISSSFKFYFYPPATGTRTIISANISGMSSYAIEVLCVPDATSSVLCDSSAYSQDSKANCTIFPKLNGVPCYSSYPFSLGYFFSYLHVVLFYIVSTILFLLGRIIHHT